MVTLARFLAESSREPMISQEELGYLSGVSRRRVNQAPQRLGEIRLLRVDYGKVTVLDLEGPKAFEG